MKKWRSVKVLMNEGFTIDQGHLRFKIDEDFSIWYIPALDRFHLEILGANGIVKELSFKSLKHLTNFICAII